MAAISAGLRAAAGRARRSPQLVARSFMSTKVLCSDPIDPVATDILNKAGFAVEQVDATKMSEAELKAKLADAQGLIVRRCEFAAKFRLVCLSEDTPRAQRHASHPRVARRSGTAQINWPRWSWHR